MAASKSANRAIGKKLDLQDFHSLMAELSHWRTDPEVQRLEKMKKSGLVLGFVKGLRLSARLIYAIRKAISHSKLETDWGHLLDAQENILSPECDIIIHLPGIRQQWNGNEKPIMDFKFIEAQKALAVVSCKSFLKVVDPEYPARIRDYVKKIFLFAECCNPKSVGNLRENAKAAGYNGFWYLYTFDPKRSFCNNDEKVWEDFLSTLRKIANRYPK